MIILPLAPILAWLLVFTRVGMILALFPVIGERFVPVRVRIVLAAMIAMTLSPIAGVDSSLFPDSTAGIVTLLARELILAMGVGLIGRIMFAIVQFAGQIAGEQMGFGLVNAIDPTGSNQISVVAELQYLMAILLFFATDLHHPILRMLAWSLEQIPPGAAVVTTPAVELLMDLGGVMFSLAVGFAMPVIVVVFAINIGLGMVARAVPQINVFMESFPLRIIAGLALTMMILGALGRLWLEMFGDMERAMGHLILLMKGS
jgi:flagellar biosynthetic protein FliR